MNDRRKKMKKEKESQKPFPKTTNSPINPLFSKKILPHPPIPPIPSSSHFSSDDNPPPSRKCRETCRNEGWGIEKSRDGKMKGERARGERGGREGRRGGRKGEGGGRGEGL